MYFYGSCVPTNGARHLRAPRKVSEFASQPSTVYSIRCTKRSGHQSVELQSCPKNGASVGTTMAAGVRQKLTPVAQDRDNTRDLAVTSLRGRYHDLVSSHYTANGRNLFSLINARCAAQLSGQGRLFLSENTVIGSYPPHAPGGCPPPLSYPPPALAPLTRTVHHPWHRLVFWIVNPVPPDQGGGPLGRSHHPSLVQ